MLSINPVHRSPWTGPGQQVPLHARQVDDAGNGLLLFAPLGGGVALLHPVGEVTRQASALQELRPASFGGARQRRPFETARDALRRARVPKGRACVRRGRGRRRPLAAQRR